MPIETPFSTALCSARAPAPRPAPSRLPAPVQPQPQMVMLAPAQRQPGMFAQMASTAAGVAVGSTVGHVVGAAITGGHGHDAPAPAPQQSQVTKTLHLASHAFYNDFHTLPIHTWPQAKTLGEAPCGNEVWWGVRRLFTSLCYIPSNLNI